MNAVPVWFHVAFAVTLVPFQLDLAMPVGGAAESGVDDASAASQQAVETPDSTAFDHVGALVVGDAFDERSRASRPWVNAGVNQETGCFHVTGGDLPDGLAMMVMDGRIARFEVGPPNRGADVRPPFGLHPGMARAAVEEAMPVDVRVSQHQYGGEGDVYIDWLVPGGRYGVRAEITNDKVDAVFWGDGDAIQLIEGCS
ncbi:hypothetical protein [Luteimonas lutimaris]|uniref:Lectin n=1 Tax=Luteimonas lutimaris TaxID=698645 RepID=A0ABP7MN56_9GAMM